MVGPDSSFCAGPRWKRLQRLVVSEGGGVLDGAFDGGMGWRPPIHK
jgi:hypothetical protein